MNNPEHPNGAPTNISREMLESLSDEELAAFVMEIVEKRARSGSPASGLRFLLNLDADLYQLQGQLSVLYGGGKHTKHRHTKYHDFFTGRIKEGERVLDMGCGIGALAFDLADKTGAAVVGIDINPVHIDIAVTRYAHPNITYIVGDVLTTPLEGPFHAVVLSNVLEHLEERPAFLRKLAAVVKPSRFLIRVPVFERDWRVPLKEELGIDYRLDPTHFTEYTLESFAAEMEEAHLVVEHQEVRWGEIWAQAVKRDEQP